MPDEQKKPDLYATCQNRRNEVVGEQATTFIERCRLAANILATIPVVNTEETAFCQEIVDVLYVLSQKVMLHYETEITQVEEKHAAEANMAIRAMIDPFQN